jgi:hypothetical protein
VKVLEVPLAEATECLNAEALIKEARQRQRKRRLLIGIVVLVAIAVSGVSYAFVTRPSARARTTSASSPSKTVSASTGEVTPDQPIGLAVSHDGDLYIADRGRNEVLEWMPSGKFRIVAGTGVAGLTGDGGRSDRAEVNDPDSLVITPNGTLYFTQAGRYQAPVSSSGGKLNTVIREITPAGTIRTIAGLHPSCPSGPVRSVPAESALLYGASLSLSPGGALAVDANLCVNDIHDQRFGPNLLLTSSGRFIKDASDPVPVVASVDCGSGIPGPGFHVFGCMSGGGNTAYGHGNELLVVRSDGSSVGYPDYQGVDFAVGDGEVVATYDGNLVRVTSSRLVPLLTNQELLSDLHIRPIADIGAPAVGADGDIYFVASIMGGGSGCQNRILDRTTGGALLQIWESSSSRNNVCF